MRGSQRHVLWGPVACWAPCEMLCMVQAFNTPNNVREAISLHLTVEETEAERGDDSSEVTQLVANLEFKPSLAPTPLPATALPPLPTPPSLSRITPFSLLLIYFLEGVFCTCCLHVSHSSPHCGLLPPHSNPSSLPRPFLGQTQWP